MNEDNLSIHNFHNIAVNPRLIFFVFEYIIDKMIYNYSRHLISVSDFASKSLLIRSGFNDKKR